MNKAMLIGRLGASPELRHTPSGNKVVSLNIACNKKYTDKNGNKKEKTEWLRVIYWNVQAENIARYLKKGSKIYAEGEIQTRKYINKQGNDAYATEIQGRVIEYLDTPSQQTSQNQQTQQEPPPPQEENWSPPPPPVDPQQQMDDIPF